MNMFSNIYKKKNVELRKKLNDSKCEILKLNQEIEMLQSKLEVYKKREKDIENLQQELRKNVYESKQINEKLREQMKKAQDIANNYTAKCKKLASEMKKSIRKEGV